MKKTTVTLQYRTNGNYRQGTEG